MHRTNSMTRCLAVVVLGLLAWGTTLLAIAHAQQGRPQTVIVPVNRMVPLQMSTKKPITNVDLKGDGGVANAKVDPANLAIVQVTGKSPGVELLILTDADGRKEGFELVVQTDVEYLKFILRKAVPTANVEPVPSANNAFVLTGTVEKAEDVQIVLNTAQSVVGANIINALRVGGVQQVQLDVIIARVNRSEARQMGFSWAANQSNYFVASTVGGSGGMTANSITPSVTGGLAALSGAPNLIFGVLSNSGSFIGFLNALRSEGLAKLLAEPRLVTLSGRPAEFVSGGEQAVPVIAAGGAGGAVSGVQFVPFGTTVRFLPIVLGNGKIYLEVAPSFDFPDPNPLFATPVSGTSGQVFGKTKQAVQTTCIIEDGQTFAIGGLIQRKADATTTKVPILGDLPFFGAAFRTINYQENEDELIILVTPRLVDPMTCWQLPKFLPGQETRSPDDFELFLEGILEAPRGPREVFPGGHYEPAYMRSLNAGSIPCAGPTGHGGLLRSNCPPGGCVTTGITSGTSHVMAPATTVSQPAITTPVTPPIPVRMPAGPAAAGKLPPLPPPGATRSQGMPADPFSPVVPPVASVDPPASLAIPLPQEPHRPTAVLQPPTDWEAR